MTRNMNRGEIAGGKSPAGKSPAGKSPGEVHLLRPMQVTLQTIAPYYGFQRLTIHS